VHHIPEHETDNTNDSSETDIKEAIHNDSITNTPPLADQYDTNADSQGEPVLTTDKSQVEQKRETKKVKKKIDSTSTQVSNTDTNVTKVDSSEWLPADKIIGTRYIGDRKQYRVRFLDNTSTWLHHTNVGQKLKDEYHLKYTLQGFRRKHKM
jgi:hypothetical protein